MSMAAKLAAMVGRLLPVLVLGFMLGACAVQLKTELTWVGGKHSDSFADVARCLATGP